MDKTIQIIESRIDLIKKTDLNDTQYFFKDNDDFSLKYSNIIGEFVHMKNYLSLRMGLNPTGHTLMNDGGKTSKAKKTRTKTTNATKDISSNIRFQF